MVYFYITWCHCSTLPGENNQYMEHWINAMVLPCIRKLVTDIISDFCACMLQGMLWETHCRLTMMQLVILAGKYHGKNKHARVCNRSTEQRQTSQPGDLCARCCRYGKQTRRRMVVFGGAGDSAEWPAVKVSLVCTIYSDNISSMHSNPTRCDRYKGRYMDSTQPHRAKEILQSPLWYWKKKKKGPAMHSPHFLLLICHTRL